MVDTGTILIVASVLIGTLGVGAVVHRSREREQAQLESLESEMRGALENNADRIEESVDKAVTEQVEKLEESQQELNEIGDEFEDVFDEMDEAVGGFSAAISTVDDFEGLRQWGDTLEDAAEPVERVANNVETWRQEQQQLLDETTDILTEWAAQHRRVEDVYEESMEGLEEWQTEHTITQRENSEALKSRLEQLQENSEAMRRTVEQLNETIQKEAETREMLAQDVPETLAGLEEVSETLADLNQRQTQTIQQLDGIATPMREAASEFETQSSQVLENIRRQAEQNESIQDDVADAIERSNRELETTIQDLQNTVAELEAAQTPEWLEYAKVVLLGGILAGVLAVAFV